MLLSIQQGSCKALSRAARCNPLPLEDLEAVGTALAHLVDDLRGKQVFVTGGTGFFGIWLLESLLHMDARFHLDLRITVLSRNPQSFFQRCPHLAGFPQLHLVAGDVRTFAFPAVPCHYLIHAAADSVVAPGTSDQDEFSTLVEGTQRILSFATRAHAQRTLYISSGAVYGQQPALVESVRESDPFQPDARAYTLGKRAAELLCCIQSGEAGSISIARCFAFLGPHLPLHAHFAAGNFIGDALRGATIHVRGDGTPIRTYLYASDLSIWLLTILLRGAHGAAYNVGAEEEISIRALAECTAEIVGEAATGRSAVHVESPASGKIGDPSRYVPSTQLAREHLGLRQTVSLREAIRKTAAWHRMP